MSVFQYLLILGTHIRIGYEGPGAARRGAWVALGHRRRRHGARGGEGEVTNDRSGK